MIRRLLLLLLLWLPPSVHAETLQPFVAGSMIEIEKRYSDQTYIVVLWSITCPPCLHELAMLSQWRTKHAGIPLVLIATDSQEETDTVTKKLVELELQQADNWLFADSYVEKLRFAIDPNWRGELPRSYLYSPGANRRAISGTLTLAMLREWHQAIPTQGPAND